MKTLKEAKIERFGHQDRYKNISTYYQITYIWEYKFLGLTFQKKEKVPILFENESDAIDFIECGCSVEIKISQNTYGKNLYDLYAYKIADPDKKYKIFKSDIPIDGYESLFIVRGYEQEKHPWVCSRGGKISDFFEKLKEREEWDKTQQEKERKDKEYVNSLYEVKTYKIEKI
jgi:hypothetical protein